MYKVIDVSDHNGVINWEAVKASGIDGAIIRIGWGSDYEKQDDSQASNNMEACERLGIPYGVYLYSYALNESQARSEAEHAKRMIQGFNPSMGVWFDMEDADAYKSKHGINVYESRELMTSFCKIFCDAIIAAGYGTGIYANKNYWDKVLLADLLPYDKWLAHWGISEPSMPCLVWQYTSDGSVDGVPSKRVDMNYYYGELPQVKPKPEEPEQPESPTYAHSIGETVEYNAIYSSSASTEALHPYGTVGVITKIKAGAANPYLVGEGTGWLNDGCIVSANAKPDVEESTNTINVGDKVKVLNAVQYNGGSFATYYSDYDVIQVKGDRVVIGKGSTVTAAINICNIEKL